MEAEPLEDGEIKEAMKQKPTMRKSREIGRSLPVCIGAHLCDVHEAESIGMAVAAAITSWTTGAPIFGDRKTCFEELDRVIAEMDEETGELNRETTRRMVRQPAWNILGGFMHAIFEERGVHGKDEGTDGWEKELETWVGRRTQVLRGRCRNAGEGRVEPDARCLGVWLHHKGSEK